MSFNLVVEHELQCRTRDFVLVDNEHTPLINSLGSFDTNLHYALVTFDNSASGKSKFRAGSQLESQRAPHRTAQLPVRGAASCCVVSYRLTEGCRFRNTRRPNLAPKSSSINSST